MRLLERLASLAIHERIVQHQVEGGATHAEAIAAANQAAAGGIGGLFHWIVANAPSIYAFAAMILGIFGVPIPSLPPRPAPST